IQVEFIGEGPETPAPEPEDAPSPASDPAPPPAAASRLQATPAPTRQPRPPDAHVATAPAVVPRRPGRGEGTPSAAARPSRRRPGHTWGQPPGMAPRDHAPVNAGPAPVPTVGRGQRLAAPSDEPGLEAGGYQVVYEPSAEARLREWREQGMTELLIPLPGTLPPARPGRSGTGRHRRRARGDCGAPGVSGRPPGLARPRRLPLRVRRRGRRWRAATPARPGACP